jgi:Transducer of regulated CREB activity, C terminus
MLSMTSAKFLPAMEMCIDSLLFVGTANSLDFELLASDDVSTLGLDPLALDELQMLTGSPVFSDPNIEETFRCDHNFNNYRLM